MNPFTPHLEEAFKLLREHMRSNDPRVSIRACRTIIAADLRYRMLEYTAVRTEYTALKHQHAATPTPPNEPPGAPASSGAPRTAQRAPRAPAPPHFDQLREELRLAPEHRELVTACHTSGVLNADRPGQHERPVVDPERAPDEPAPNGRSAAPPPRRASLAASLMASAGSASRTTPIPRPLHPYNST